MQNKFEVDVEDCKYLVNHYLIDHHLHSDLLFDLLYVLFNLLSPSALEIIPFDRALDCHLPLHHINFLLVKTFICLILNFLKVSEEQFDVF